MKARNEQYRWGVRADAHDDLLDQGRQEAAAEGQKALEEMRLQFEIEDQSRIANRAWSKMSCQNVLDGLSNWGYNP